jgi:hypothetical protein
LKILPRKILRWIPLLEKAEGAGYGERWMI